MECIVLKNSYRWRKK